MGSFQLMKTLHSCQLAHWEKYQLHAKRKYLNNFWIIHCCRIFGIKDSHNKQYNPNIHIRIASNTWTKLWFTNMRPFTSYTAPIFHCNSIRDIHVMSCVPHPYTVKVLLCVLRKRTFTVLPANDTLWVQSGWWDTLLFRMCNVWLLLLRWYSEKAVRWSFVTKCICSSELCFDGAYW